MKLRLLLLISCLYLSACGAGRLVRFPYDVGGRSLNSPFAEQKPRVSGRYVVFTSDRRGSQDIFLYDMTNRALVDLPGLNALDMIASTPSVTEDGRFIIFHGVREGRSGIYLYDRDTRQLRNLTENIKAEVRNPTISADGFRIAFESSAKGQWDIVLINRNGQVLSR
ncbi:MAG TPA: TolB family protein [Leptolyngbyaceae cyanobacterium M33_DOE_097]|uniref:Tol biopolymer transporter periplasmic protein n=1 Tax=Oscillatoriales cyanobacterium SpSt-418 TaxID=2282169 RepID=A0A7C3KEA3_9CYAN|nr:TolB family protein [Leptolyngbyaceae cyanobacterium M33_DOE_097]